MSLNPVLTKVSTRKIPADEAGIREAARIIASGGLVALPTETVYGLGADAGNATAVARIFEAKERPSFNPLIAHFADAEAAGRAGRFDDNAKRLAAAFWPGPLTLVVPIQPHCPVSELARAGLASVAVRVPNHPVAHALLQAVGRPVAAPSANRSGQVSPTTADHVLADLGGRIDLVLDGGATQLGMESTIIDCTVSPPRWLRPGAIERAAVERLLGMRLAERGAGRKSPIAPGELARHYATRARLRLDAVEVNPGEALLAFGPKQPRGAGRAAIVLDLSPKGDLIEAAANLFAHLRALDATGVHTIAVAPIPRDGLGEAIRDRLARAAGVANETGAAEPEPAAKKSEQIHFHVPAERNEGEPAAPPAAPKATEKPAKKRDGAKETTDSKETKEAREARDVKEANDTKETKETKKSRADPLDKFAEIVGDKYAIRSPAEQAPYLREERDIYFGKAALVVKPATPEEVAGILALANETLRPVVAQGGNTGLVGGQIPFDARAIVLSTTRLNRIREIDLDANTMTCEAGVVLAQAQQAAREHGRLFPLSLGAEGSCTIGGNLSTNAGGTNALAYGVARDLVLGLEVVLADGRIWRGLRKLKKDNTGYDLRHLFIGAEGTLGIITAAVLKLFPAPRSVATAFVGVNSPAEAVALLGAAQARGGSSVTTFELMPRIGIEYTVRSLSGVRDPLSGAHPWYVLIELSSPMEPNLRAILEEVLATGSAQGLVSDATIAASETQRNMFWRLRAGVAELQKVEGASIKHDVSVPVSAIPAFLEEATAAVQKRIPGTRPIAFGHVGDGNIHYNIAQPVGADREEYLSHWDEVNEIVYEVLQRYGGSISAEHGIGVQKRKFLPKVKDPVELELMRSLKRLLDPRNILNPGKVL